MPKNIKKTALQTRSGKPRYNPEDYQVVVRWSPEDNVYLAEVPALDGCITHGRTPQSAFKNATKAAALWLEDAEAHGDSIPKPAANYSGKLTLRLPKSMHQRIVEQAERDGVSINQWIVSRIAAA